MATLRLYVTDASSSDLIFIKAGESIEGFKIVFQATHTVALESLVAPNTTVTLSSAIGRLPPTEHAWAAHLNEILKKDDAVRRINLTVEFHGPVDAATAPVDHPCTVTIPSDTFKATDAAVLGHRPVAPFYTTLDVEGVAQEIAKASNILVMTGAGISVAAGIPDFRTPGIGLYSNLAKYDLPEPADLFTLDYLKEKPQVFYTAANEMKLWPGSFAPTHVHHFLKLLDDHGKLLRCYTQNIDGMERLAGLNPEKLVEAHGTFSAAHCIKCKLEVPIDVVKACVDRMEVPYCPDCKGIVKPDVVFFGEALPARFGELLFRDMRSVDMLLVIGTSLVVYPFASIHSSVPEHIPRVLVNMERAGNFEDTTKPAAVAQRGPSRDAFLKGDCQAAVTALSSILGWGQQLEDAFAAGKAKIAAAAAAAAVPKL